MCTNIIRIISNIFKYFFCVAIVFQKARLKVKLLEIKEEQYNCIRAKEYLKAEELNLEITKLAKEIEDLEEELTTPMATDDVAEEKEKNDSQTMTVCLEIMCTMMQSPSIMTLVPTLRSLLDHMVLESLEVSIIKNSSLCKSSGLGLSILLTLFL